MPLISETLKRLLVCPADKADLKEIESLKILECEKCGRRFPVRDGIPVMILEDPNDASSKEGDARR